MQCEFGKYCMIGLKWNMSMKRTDTDINCVKFNTGGIFINKETISRAEIKPGLVGLQVTGLGHKFVVQFTEDEAPVGPVAEFTAAQPVYLIGHLYGKDDRIEILGPL